MHSTWQGWRSHRRRLSAAALGAFMMVGGFASTARADASAAKTLPESIDVPAFTKLGAIKSKTKLNAKKTYSITVTGTATYNDATGTYTVDADYCVTGPACQRDANGQPLTPPTWHNGSTLGIRDAGNLFSFLDEFEGCCPLKHQLDYSDAHTYTITFKGIAGPIELYDPRYRDADQGATASGGWHVVISLGRAKPGSKTCKPTNPPAPSGCP